MTSQRAVSEVITARSARKITMRGMREEIDVILRSAGWRVAAVPFSKVPVIGRMAWHPIDALAKGVLRGAVNILPDHRVGAYALIFINSGCLSR